MLPNIKCTPLPVVFVSTHILYPSAHSVILLCLCVCGHVYVVYEDTRLYNDMGIT